MSLIKVMAQASKFRRYLRSAGGKIGLKGIKKRKSLRGGMWAKKRAIGAAYNVQAFGAGVTAGERKKLFGKAYAASHVLSGQAKGQFAKRYPKTQFGIGATKVAGIGATGAWILNDKDMKS